MPVKTFQPTVSFKDAAFDPAQSAKFCLVMQVGTNGIYTAVLDNISNTFVAFESYDLKKVSNEKDLAAEIGKLIREHEWLSNGFKKSDVMLVTERFTLVPSSFFDQSRAKEFLSFNHPVNETDELSVDNLRNADARLIYANEKELIKQLKTIQGVRIHHHLATSIERQLSIHKTKPGRRALVNVQKERFDLVISEAGKLLLANTFNYQTSEDLIYFLLFACEQLKMNPDTMEVEIVGETPADSAIVMLVRKYVRNVSLASAPAEANFAKDFSQFPSHYHASLFSLHYFS